MHASSKLLLVTIIHFFPVDSLNLSRSGIDPATSGLFVSPTLHPVEYTNVREFDFHGGQAFVSLLGLGTLTQNITCQNGAGRLNEAGLALFCMKS